MWIPSLKLGWIPPWPTLRLASTAISSTDRIGCVNAAGESAYIRKDITVTVLKEISHLSDNYFHQFWLKLQHRKLQSVVICISYGLPDCPLSFFEELLKPSYIQALTMNKSIMVLGDLNCNVLKESPESKALSNFLSETNLKQIITTSTRIKDTCESLIDVILVWSPVLVHACRY